MAKRRRSNNLKKQNCDTSSKNKDLVINHLTVQRVQRKSQDIENWRRAMIAAESPENPNRVSLYDLYEDVILDSRVKSCISKRVKPITNSKIIFTRDSKQDDEITAICNTEGFREMIAEIVKSKMWGYSLVEMWIEKGSIKYKLVPRKHVIPEFEKIVQIQGNALSNGYCYKEEPFADHMVWAGKSDDLGELLGVCQYVIYKRGGFGDWANFAEIFGQPFREARYANYDDATRIELERAMDETGGAGYVILPESAQFKFHDNNNSSGNTTLFETLRQACNEEITIGLLGQTMTTENGSSHSQSEVHKEEQNEFTQDDLIFTLNVLNNRFVEVLAAFGYNVEGGVFEISKEVNITTSENLQNIKLVKEMGVPVDDEYIYEIAGIPKPKNYNSIKDEEKQEKKDIEKQQQENQKIELFDNADFKLFESNILQKLKDLKDFFLKALK